MANEVGRSPHGVRVGLVALLAYFYVDGFVRDASVVELVAFALAAPAYVGAFATFEVRRRFDCSPVRASA
jgi:hypothetical protein